MLGFTLVVPLAIIIITGNILRRRGFYSDSDIKALVKTLYWIIIPPMLFRIMFMSGREVLTQHNLLIATTICYAVTTVAAWILAALWFHKGNRKRIALSTFAAIRANNIYLGFPVIFLAQGDAGLEQASVYFAVSTMSFQFISIMAGEAAVSGEFNMSSFIKTIKNMLLNPLVISCGAGITVALLGVEELPRVIDEAIKILSNAASAVALLALGGTLDLSRFSRIIDIMRETWADSLLKMLIHPALMWLLLMAFPVPQPLLQATVMLSAMPSAVNNFIMASEMKMDGEYAANLVAATTLLSALTIPAWASLLGMV